MEQRRAGALLGCAVLFAGSGAALAAAAERAPVLTTPHFSFYSDLDTNLNDALIAAGVARKGAKPELFHSGDEAACFAGLPPSARAAWEGAVGYYAEIVSPADFGDRRQFLLRMQLAGFDPEWTKEPADRQFVEIARSFRAAAISAYTACRWAAQDAKNRRWIEELKPRLAADEAKLALRLEQLYKKSWNGLPIPVDVVETVDWSGANTIWRDAGGGHSLISNSYQGLSALEVVFHESSHLLMRRDDPLQRTLADAAKAANFHLPGDLWHVVLFYTTGETVRRILADEGHPGYTPMLYGIMERGGSWNSYRQALESAWRPYVEGEQELATAAARLVDALRKPEGRRPAPG